MTTEVLTYTLFGFDSNNRLIKCTEMQVPRNHDVNQLLSRQIVGSVNYVGFVEEPFEKIKTMPNLERKLKYFTATRSVSVKIT